jgi:hypothetical protein
VRLTSPPKNVDVEKNLTDASERKRFLTLVTRNVRKLFGTGALIFLLPQLKQYRLDLTALQEKM